MNMWFNQDGTLWQCPITMPCHNPKCLGTFFLQSEFSNGQELWRCDKCREEYWSFTTVAKALLYEGTSTIESGDLYMKNCAYCKHSFQTFNPEDDVCEACSMFASCGYPN